MWINILKKTERPQGLYAVEKVTLIYTALTTIIIFCMFRELQHPGEMLVGRAYIVVATFLLMYVFRLYPCRFTALLRIVVQMGLLSYWYPDTFEFNRHFENLDHIFASIEQFVFNGQPSIWFSNAYPRLLVSEAFNMGYFFYYPMIASVMIFIFIRRYGWFEKAAFIITCAFFLYYLIYIFVPVAGPQFYFPAIGFDNAIHGNFVAIGHYFNLHPQLSSGPGYQQGFFYSLVDASQQVGERPTAAFPSSHVGISTILMIIAWRANKNFFFCLAPIYVLLCAATVYIQAHYAIDAIVGFFSAFLMYYVASLLYKRFLR
ncbi:MAG: phosphatase PAP2 family protein [Bacteroidaceae bacterium]|nr:phosphatase PAP2 family protein [Bacteroidaceae bacterium]